jgi:membrane-associated phospholipid phosphatase
MRTRILAAYIFIAACVSTVSAQTGQEFEQDIEPREPPSVTPNAAPDPEYRAVDASLDLLRDERDIWRDMFQIHNVETRWAIPIVAANAVALSTDSMASLNMPTSLRVQKLSHGISSLGAPVPLVAAGLTMYFAGRYTGSPRLRETGILGSQALIHSVIITGVFEAGTNRRLPNAQGSSEFWSGGHAWPSGHAAMFWALSTVVAKQYHDRPLVRIGAYSMAAAVSVSRFTGGVHFPSDALASSLLGYFVGRWVVHRHSTYP